VKLTRRETAAYKLIIKGSVFIKVAARALASIIVRLRELKKQFSSRFNFDCRVLVNKLCRLPQGIGCFRNKPV
jgi:hypothetical protein